MAAYRGDENNDTALPRLAELSQIPTDQQLSEFAGNLLKEDPLVAGSRQWEKLMINLGSSAGDIFRHKVQNPYNEWAPCFYALVQWKQRQYKEATIERLILARQECNVTHVAYEFLYPIQSLTERSPKRKIKKELTPSLQPDEPIRKKSRGYTNN